MLKQQQILVGLAGSKRYACGGVLSCRQDQFRASREFSKLQRQAAFSLAFRPDLCGKLLIRLYFPSPGQPFPCLSRPPSGCSWALSPERTGLVFDPQRDNQRVATTFEAHLPTGLTRAFAASSTRSPPHLFERAWHIAYSGKFSQTEAKAWIEA